MNGTLPKEPDGRRRTVTLGLLGALVALGVVYTADLVSAAEMPVTHTVVIKATSFAPQRLTIKRGDTVVWVNEDPFPHTATAVGVFDSKSIAAGGSWKYRPLKTGETAYICSFHPNMTGTLKVE